MRNLKKVLSLVLAVAMMVSICVVGAGAVNYDDFKDEGTITKKQAVETLVSLDVLNGYNGGETFAPTQPVTRAEMATIICRILAGGESLIPDATKEIPTYADIDGHWAESYIEYCTSLGIVSGKGNGIFDPQANVTAAEAAKMVMTTLGYNADIEGFKGTGWDINTMAKANTLKLTANLVSEISANNAITREQVAQLIYNALSTPVVQNYTGAVANTWISSGKDAYQETLLETKFNAQKITGVVVANEYADLYGDKPIKKGTTELALMDGDNDLTGETKTFNVSTTLDEIGESIIVYWNDTTKKVVYGDFQDTGLNVVTEFTAKTKNITKGEGSVSLAKDVEYFVNYGIGSKATSDYRIEFVVILAATDTDAIAEVEANDMKLDGTDTENGTVMYSKAIRPGKDISAWDIAMMQEIFATADKEADTIVDGEVYVGTQSNKDVSDTMSWKKFDEEYLNVDLDNTKVVENENGNYIKAVDFNNDGDVDYVLKTIYTATDVAKIDKKGVITLSTEDQTLTGNDAVNMLTDKTDVVCDDELATGDVVLYAVIDGTAYAYLADMTTAEIDKVNRNKLIATTTDGDEYEQSGVNQYIDNEFFDDGVKNLAGKTSYDLYFDRYGYLVAFTETATSGDFTLLLDGWFNETKTADEYSVRAYIDGEIEIVDITKNGNQFVDKDHVEHNGWNGLRQFGGLNYSNVQDPDNHTWGPKAASRTWTTVASLSDDGVLTPVGKVYNKKTIEMIDMGVNIVDRDGETGTVYDSNNKDTAYTKSSPAEEVEVRALSSTVYYYVYGQGKNAVVKEYVGYGNLPKLSAEDKGHIEDVYAVGTKVQRDSTVKETYYTANVVVVEFDKAYKTNVEQIFVYDSPEVKNNVKIETLDVIRADGTNGSVDVDLSEYRDYDPAYGKLVAPGLYYLYETNDEDVYTIKAMTPEEIMASGKYTVGTVLTNTFTHEADWSELTAYKTQEDLIMPIDSSNKANTPEFKHSEGEVYYSLSYKYDGTWKYDIDDDGVKETIPEYIASLDTTLTNREVLAEKVRENKVDYANTVLVAHNSKDEIVYAISFAHTDGKNTNFAQYVWQSLIPEAEEPVVVEDNAVVALTKAIKAITEITEDNKTEAQELVDSVADVDTKDASAEELKELQDAAKALQEMIDAYGVDKTLEEARQAVIDNIDERTAEGGAWATWTPGMIEAAKAAVNASDEPTDTVATDAAGAVEARQKAALDTLTEYTAGDYNAAEWAQIEEIQNEAKTAIEASTADAEAMNKIATDANTATEAIKTAAELADEKAVADAKTAIEALDDENALAVDDYTEDAVKTALDTAIDGIDEVTVEIGTQYADGASVTVTLTKGEATATATVTVLVNP